MSKFNLIREQLAFEEVTLKLKVWEQLAFEEGIYRTLNKMNLSVRHIHPQNFQENRSGYFSFGEEDFGAIKCPCGALGETLRHLFGFENPFCMYLKSSHLFHLVKKILQSHFVHIAKGYVDRDSGELRSSVVSCLPLPIALPDIFIVVEGKCILFELWQRGAFPNYPTPNGLIFMPITFELPMSSQLQEIDIVLHKATDEIVSVGMSTSSEFFDQITYTKGMQELERCIEHHPDICIVDPLNNIYPVLDRLKIQQILLGLENLNVEGRCKIRAPRFLKLDNFEEPNLVQRLAEAKLAPPSIVKPQVACGVADAHSMVVIYLLAMTSNMHVQVPLVIGVVFSHSSPKFIITVVGDFFNCVIDVCVPRAGCVLKNLAELVPVHLNSLESFLCNGNCQNANHEMDIQLVTDAACWLRRMLNLTIFGFDVVIQENTGDHVIVDVNYLPSFKEVPDNVAIPAFWEAIKSKYELEKIK
ncbi:hypothetical protein RHMOL_Rhmol09G0003400 [Rhododendron molle]|uniref:Uncharacterized protein n=1 Tax=Rhododendron molle TaxID=49168 RepID=A0ACC0M8P9_RHOML|nr:hypothetical protein RHMOL_Rhmol09G0003400 [Rhododendron molle]